MNERVKNGLKIAGAVWAVAVAVNEMRLRSRQAQQPSGGALSMADRPLPEPASWSPSIPSPPAARESSAPRFSPPVSPPSPVYRPAPNGPNFVGGKLPGNVVDYTQGRLNR